MYYRKSSFKDLSNENDIDSVENLVLKFGKDSLSYLSLEKGKNFFVSKEIEGCIAYAVVGKVALCIGDPICDSEYLEEFLEEFLEFCKSKKIKVCFSSISKEMTCILQKQNFVISKYGEEAILELGNYELNGKKTLKLRQKIKRAEKQGIQVIEYEPERVRDINLEEKIEETSNEWFKAKKGKLIFSMGELHFERPLNRRYFISLDEALEVQAIVTFSPYDGGKAYFLDVMRRNINSVPGVMEYTIISAALKMKKEGVEALSLGLAPLVGIDTKKAQVTSLERCMNFIYKNVKCDYGFQGLYNYKNKFAPTHWRERYIAYERNVSLIKIAYVMMVAKNASGVVKRMVIKKN